MTDTDVIYQRRVAAITYAGEIGNIAGGGSGTDRLHTARITVDAANDRLRRKGVATTMWVVATREAEPETRELDLARQGLLTEPVVWCGHERVRGQEQQP